MLYDLYRKQKTSPQKAMEGQFLFGIYRLEEWKGLVEAFGFSPGTLVELDHMDESRTLHKLDSYYGYCFGFVHPLKVRKEAAAGIGLYCRQREVILISENTDQLLDFFRLLQQLPAAQLSAEHILSLFFEYLLKKHKEEHDQLEDLIEELDNDILNDNLQNDEQFSDVCEELLEDENDLFAREQLHHLRICSDRVERLGQHTRTLRDYSVQVRESYQAQVDIRLNRMMYIFTIVTVIFLPLTLIVGWYGMNFTGMPELHWRYGYPFVIILSLVSIGICVWSIYRKRIRK